MHSPTLLLVLMILVALMSCIACAVWRLYPNIRGLREWFFAFGFALINIFNFVFKPGLLPALDMLITQFCLVMTGVMASLGVYRFLGLTNFPIKSSTGVVLTTLLTGGYFLIVEPNTNARFMVGSIATGLFLLLAAIVMLKGSLRLPARLLFAYALLFHGVFTLARSFMIKVPSKDLLFADFSLGISQLILIEQILMTVLLGLGIIMLVNEHVSQELQVRADRDALTNLYNRGAFVRQLSKAISLSSRLSVPLSLMVIDMDRFKSINDRFGHAAGDLVLLEFAKLVNKTIRNEDTAGRLGGEEFCIFLPNTPLNAALQIAERLRQNVAGAVVQHEKDQIDLKISVGVASLSDSDTVETLIMRADRAMYAAKLLGRNRVEFEQLALN